MAQPQLECTQTQAQIKDSTEKKLRAKRFWSGGYSGGGRTRIREYGASPLVNFKSGK